MLPSAQIVPVNDEGQTRVPPRRTKYHRSSLCLLALRSQDFKLRRILLTAGCVLLTSVETSRAATVEYLNTLISTT